MPIITIKTPYPIQRLCLKTIAEAINKDTGIEKCRLNIFIEQYLPSNFYNCDGSQPVIIQVAASAHNGKQKIQAVMSAVSKTIVQQLNIEDNQIAVYSQPIESEYLLINNRFK